MLVSGAGTNAVAGNDSIDPAPPSRADSQQRRSPVPTPRMSSATKSCQADQDTFRVLTLTTFKGEARVDCAFVISGRATWTP